MTDGLPRRPNRNALQRTQPRPLLPRACADFQLPAELPKTSGEQLHLEALTWA
jgi:hypothetical protein